MGHMGSHKVRIRTLLNIHDCPLYSVVVQRAVINTVSYIYINVQDVLTASA